MERERLRLRRALGRFKKDELVTVLQELGVEVEGKARTSLKQQLISMALEKLASGGITQRDITRLELHYILSHSSSVQWKVYQLHRVNGSFVSSADIDTAVFLKRFLLYLGDFSSYEIVDTNQAPGHWMCLHLTGEGHAPYTCFLLRCPPVPFVLISGLRKSHLHCIMESLAVTLECTGWSDAKLAGRNVSSLLDLFLNQHSQGPHTAFRLNQRDPNPLLAVVQKRTHQEEEDDVMRKRKSRLEEEKEESVEIKRRRAVEKTFGTNPLPKLEKFTFKLEAPISEGSEVIHCCLKFTGSSVLEGVKQCVASDLITLPVPKIVANIHSHASNCVTIVTQTTEDPP